ncbi:hypothetical protein B0H67DRAFT_20624 [Lasiosphaeris hirsuta]|uniref:Uncharacterized protein n=1 Tax=Lasiosphaeris hirsuta TaxID=260670 RepID=A0AA40E7P8_9PEZI|nr:hypothetical protein B0H67DRAFT_20624 [Lasiosphaeris hirsuta]
MPHKGSPGTRGSGQVSAALLGRAVIVNGIAVSKPRLYINVEGPVAGVDATVLNYPVEVKVGGIMFLAQPARSAKQPKSHYFPSFRAVFFLRPTMAYASSTSRTRQPSGSSRYGLG